MSAICRLLYASKAQAPAQARHRLLARSSILAASRMNNRASGVTGALVCGSAYFFQVLEGSPAAIDATMLRIRRDHRHSSIVTLQRTSVQQRQFSHLPMAEIGWAGQGAWVDSLLPLAHQGHAPAVESLHTLLLRCARDEFDNEPVVQSAGSRMRGVAGRAYYPRLVRAS
ncbi:MAG: BLUF domain-containing protein [Janthinobacterium lividum]